MRGDRSGSAAARRPQVKAARFIFTASPLSSIAFSIAAAGERHAAGLVGIAEHEHVGGDRIAEKRGGDRGRIDEGHAPSAPAAPLMARFRRSAGSEKSALRVKSPGITSAVLTTSAVCPSLTEAQHLLGAGHHEVAAEHEVRRFRR